MGHETGWTEEEKVVVSVGRIHKWSGADGNLKAND